MRRDFLALGFMILPFASIGCASPPPYEDYSIARAAVMAAKDAESSRYVPDLMNQALQKYHDGEKNYKENDFNRAKVSFKSAIKLAEKAEMSARIKKFTTGGGSP